MTPTLAATPGDLSLVMPKRILDGIIEMIYALDKIAPGTANDDTLLYGVEVKFYNMEVALDKNLETCHQGPVRHRRRQRRDPLPVPRQRQRRVCGPVYRGKRLRIPENNSTPEEVPPGVRFLHVSSQNSPVMTPFSSTSIFSAAGTRGRPGMVMMSPVGPR